MNHPVFSVPATPAEAARLLDEPLEALLDSAAALREQHQHTRGQAAENHRHQDDA